MEKTTKKFQFNEEKYFQILFIFGIISTFYTNRINHGTWIEMIGGLAGICNIYLTATRNKYFVIPSSIWIVCFMIIAYRSALVYDIFQYIYYLSN